MNIVAIARDEQNMCEFDVNRNNYHHAETFSINLIFANPLYTYVYLSNHKQCTVIIEY